LNSLSDLFFYGSIAGGAASGAALLIAPEAAPGELEGLQAARGGLVVSSALSVAGGAVDFLAGRPGALGRSEINEGIFTALEAKHIKLGNFAKAIVEKALDKAEESLGIDDRRVCGSRG
jgi:hypothetical protein